MEIGSFTGKADSKEWEKALNYLHQAGFSYGYFQVVDLTIGKHFWQIEQILVKPPATKEYC